MRSLRFSPFVFPCLAALAAGAAGCSGGAQGWAPAPPAGTTYEYEYQGYKQKTTTGFGGVVPVAPHAGIAYGGAFAFREGRDLRGDGWKDPFAQSSPIDGVAFNPHLAGRGIPLAASVAAPPAPAPSPAPPAPASSGGAR